MRRKSLRCGADAAGRARAGPGADQRVPRADQRNRRRRRVVDREGEAFAVARAVNRRSEKCRQRRSPRPHPQRADSAEVVWIFRRPRDAPSAATEAVAPSVGLRLRRTLSIASPCDLPTDSNCQFPDLAQKNAGPVRATGPAVGAASWGVACVCCVWVQRGWALPISTRRPWPRGRPARGSR